jgi:hypothetical protein
MNNLEKAVTASKHGAAICYVGFGANYYARTVNGKIVVRFNGFRDDLPVGELPEHVENLKWYSQVFTRMGCDIIEPTES